MISRDGPRIQIHIEEDKESEQETTKSHVVNPAYQQTISSFSSHLNLLLPCCRASTSVHGGGRRGSSSIRILLHEAIQLFVEVFRCERFIGFTGAFLALGRIARRIAGRLARLTLVPDWTWALSKRKKSEFSIVVMRTLRQEERRTRGKRTYEVFPLLSPCSCPSRSSKGGF